MLCNHYTEMKSDKRKHARENVKETECVSIFLRAIVLQTYSSNECINSPTCRVESPTSLF